MRLFKDESGIAMVTAVMATLVVSTFAVTGFQLARHNLDQSANDRRRVSSIHAAEAGIDSFLLYLSTAPTTGTACWLPNDNGTIPSAPVARTLSASPPASYTVSASYFADTNATTPLTCSNGTVVGSTSPATVKITSSGTAANETRKMEAWYYITANSSPNPPKFYGAVYSYTDATFSGGSAQFSSASHDGDLYSETGNINLSSSSYIDGVTEARGGTITLSGSAQVMKDATAYGKLSTSGSVIIWGNGRSSNADVANGAVIKGVEYYCTSKSGVGLTSPFTAKDCNPSLPVQRNSGQFPAISYHDTDWYPSSGLPEGAYTVNNFSSCTAAHDFVMAGHTGNQLVRLTGCTTLTFSGEDIPVNDDLAIISDGNLTLSGGSKFVPGVANSGYFLRLFFHINSAAGSCNSTKGINFSGGSTTGSGIFALLNTPCLADFSGGSFSGTGQVQGGKVNFSGGSNINAIPISMPGGTTTTSGFIQKFRYRREVI